MINFDESKLWKNFFSLFLICFSSFQMTSVSIDKFERGVLRLIILKTQSKSIIRSKLDSD